MTDIDSDNGQKGDETAAKTPLYARCLAMYILSATRTIDLCLKWYSNTQFNPILSDYTNH